MNAWSSLMGEVSHSHPNFINCACLNFVWMCSLIEKERDLKRAYFNGFVKGS